MPLKIRYKAPTGPGTLDLADDATVKQLFDAVKEKTATTDITIKYGWPPKSLEIGQYNASVVLLNLQRESLTIVPAETAAPKPTSTPARQPSATPSNLDIALGQRDVNDGPVTIKIPGEDAFLGKLGGDGANHRCSVVLR